MAVLPLPVLTRRHLRSRGRRRCCRHLPQRRQTPPPWTVAVLPSPPAAFAVPSPWTVAVLPSPPTASPCRRRGRWRCCRRRRRRPPYCRRRWLGRCCCHRGQPRPCCRRRCLGRCCGCRYPPNWGHWGREPRDGRAVVALGRCLVIHAAGRGGETIGALGFRL